MHRDTHKYTNRQTYKYHDSELFETLREFLSPLTTNYNPATLTLTLIMYDLTALHLDCG